MIVLNMPEFLDDESLDQIKGGSCGCQSCNHCNCNKNQQNEPNPIEPDPNTQSLSCSILVS